MRASNKGRAGGTRERERERERGGGGEKNVGRQKKLNAFEW